MRKKLIALAAKPSTNPRRRKVLGFVLALAIMVSGASPALAHSLPHSHSCSNHGIQAHNSGSSYGHSSSCSWNYATGNYFQRSYIYFRSSGHGSWTFIHSHSGL